VSGWRVKVGGGMVVLVGGGSKFGSTEDKDIDERWVTRHDANLRTAM